MKMIRKEYPSGKIIAISLIILGIALSGCLKEGKNEKVTMMPDSFYTVSKKLYNEGSENIDVMLYVVSKKDWNDFHIGVEINGSELNLIPINNLKIESEEFINAPKTSGLVYWVEKKFNIKNNSIMEMRINHYSQVNNTDYQVIAVVNKNKEFNMNYLN